MPDGLIRMMEWLIQPKNALKVGFSFFVLAVCSASLYYLAVPAIKISGTHADKVGNDLGQALESTTGIIQKMASGAANPNATERSRPTAAPELPVGSITARLRKAFENKEIQYLESARNDPSFKQRLNTDLHQAAERCKNVVNKQYDEWDKEVPSYVEKYVDQTSVDSLKEKIRMDLKIDKGVESMNEQIGKELAEFLSRNLEVRGKYLLSEIQNMLRNENYTPDQIASYCAQFALNAEGQEFFRNPGSGSYLAEIRDELKNDRRIIDMAAIGAGLAVIIVTGGAATPAVIAVAVGAIVIGIADAVVSIVIDKQNRAAAIESVKQAIRSALKDLKNTTNDKWEKQFLDIEKLLDEMFDKFIKQKILGIVS